MLVSLGNVMSWVTPMCQKTLNYVKRKSEIDALLVAKIEALIQRGH